MLDRFEQFTASISAINRCVQKLERDEMEKYGYKGAFAQYLMVLSSHPEGLTAAQLCEHSDRDKAAVSRIVSEMIDKGLVFRKGEEKNYRAKLLLTEEGFCAADFVKSRAKAAVEAVGKELSDSERAVFYIALNSISKNLEELCRNGIPN